MSAIYSLVPTLGGEDWPGTTGCAGMGWPSRVVPDEPVPCCCRPGCRAVRVVVQVHYAQDA